MHGKSKLNVKRIVVKNVTFIFKSASWKRLCGKLKKQLRQCKPIFKYKNLAKICLGLIILNYVLCFVSNERHAPETEEIRSHNSEQVSTQHTNKSKLDDHVRNSPVLIPEFPWTWVCVENGSYKIYPYCEKIRYTTITNPPINSTSTSIPGKVSQEVCWLTCGKRRSLWPFPSKKCYLGKTLVAFHPDDLKFVKYKVKVKDTKTLQLMQDAYQLALTSINNMFKIKEEEDRRKETNNAYIHVTLSIIKRATTDISLKTDESYSIIIYEIGKHLTVSILGKSFFGIRHGLETLTQLITFDKINNCLQILNDVEIVDKPMYPYRGLMIDTARNFIPTSVLKRVIDGMSYNKMNMLHWHITDSNSFPFYSKSVPKMTQFGAYSESEIYKPNEIQNMIQYARLRGVKIIPELDTPAHTGNGWQWGPEEGLGELAFCVNAEPWEEYCGQPPCGQLNPANPNVYKILMKLYGDMLELFDNDLFHMGGDEVHEICWNWQNPDVEAFRKINHLTYPSDLWVYFQRKAFEVLVNSSKHKKIIPILWDSQLTSLGKKQNFLDAKDYIIQVWSAKTTVVRMLLMQGYPLIFSNQEELYFDKGFGSWLGFGHNSKYINWQQVYDFNKAFMQYPFSNTKQVINNFYGSLPQILGGEGTLWSEKIDEDNLEIKIWPRASALAESLWSNPKSRSAEVYARLLIQSERMRNRGIRVDRRQPKSCEQLTGHCDDFAKL